MATLVLTSVAGALTAGSTGFGALLVNAGAAVAGRLIDSMLFGGGRDGSHVEGPRLDSLHLTGSSEGAPIARAYGTVRLGGTIFWGTDFEEVVATEATGGKGSAPRSSSTTYTYFANFAVGICEGPIAYINRVWADGKELDLTDISVRFYTGTEDQVPDSLITAVEGVDGAPAYRGTAYAVFERLPLEPFGNRIPQLSFEVMRTVPGALASIVRGVTLIPGATEWGYEPGIVEQSYVDFEGRVTSTNAENRHLPVGQSDLMVALDHLAFTLPNVETVLLVVAWFGDDLRAGSCTVRPKVENREKRTAPDEWSAAGLTREMADLVTNVDGTTVAYGGSPSDASVVRCIRELKSRGYRVVLYPFMMMDIAADNTLPNPYSDDAAENGQSAYPWRGRITVSPAPGMAGTVDKTPSAADQVAAFLGTAAPGDFATDGEGVTYSGPSEWRYRRFVLHMAALARAAGGVDAFTIGSEMVGLSTSRSATNTFPFVDGLVDLAADVKGMLGSGTLVSYAADWSEYHSYRPPDGSGDIHFHLDPLWSSDDVDFIGIDNYFPLADWREGEDHLDYDPDGAATTYDLGYLKGNVEGGEYFDWYYANAADRAAQVRTPITDGAHNEQWVWRQKDLRGWWTNAHHPRWGGVRRSATAWLPGSKPVWFTEVGCPSVDKGANQPNVFVDQKSSESALPHFSTGARDDVIQHRYLEAMLGYWADDNNPASTEYAGRMIDVANSHVWTWDARPHPTFPLDSASWGDAPNWRRGHWLSARAGGVYVPDLLRHLADTYGCAGVFDDAYGTCDGYVLESAATLREAVQPLSLAFLFDLVARGAEVRAVTRRAAPLRATLDPVRLVTSGTKAAVRRKRAQETELPRVARLNFLDAEGAYSSAVVQAERLATTSEQTADATLPVVIDQARAQTIVDAWLADLWAARDGMGFALPRSALALEPGDVVELEAASVVGRVRLTRITDGADRNAEATGFAAAPFRVAEAAARPSRRRAGGHSAPNAFLEVMDLPQIGTSDPGKPMLAAHGSPWGGAAVYRSPTTDGWTLDQMVGARAVLGETREDLVAGPAGRWHRVTVRVALYSGTLSSVTDLELFEGANTFALEVDGAGSNVWEVFQAREATPEPSAGVYDLAMLIRGQRGTDHRIRGNVAAGARLVRLDTGGIVQPARFDASDIGRSVNWRTGPAAKPIDDPSYATEAVTCRGEGLRPFAPAHPRMVREASGDVVITWVRRTRVGGDVWLDEDDVPLGEASERYEVRIVDGGTLRKFTTSTPIVTYTAAEQTTDFGSLPAVITARIAQLSTTVGRGATRTLTVTF